MGFSEAKARLSDVFDDVQRSRPRVVARKRGAPVVLVRQDELTKLLAQHAPFTTRMSRAEDGTVSIWLEQFQVYGSGATIPEAVEDLLDEVEQYVEEWADTLQHSPNHAPRRWWVYRVELARDRDELRDALFPAPPPAPPATWSQPPARSARFGDQAPTAPAGMPAHHLDDWLAVALAMQLGLPDDEIAILSPEDALQRWLDWCARAAQD